MTGEIIRQPVVDSVGNIQLCEFLEQGGMADRVKRLAEVLTDDNNVGMIRQQVGDYLENGDDSSSSRACGSECKLVIEDQ